MAEEKKRLPPVKELLEQIYGTELKEHRHHPEFQKRFQQKMEEYQEWVERQNGTPNGRKDT